MIHVTRSISTVLEENDMIHIVTIALGIGLYCSLVLAGVL